VARPPVRHTRPAASYLDGPPGVRSPGSAAAACGHTREGGRYTIRPCRARAKPRRA